LEQLPNKPLSALFVLEQLPKKAVLEANNDVASVIPDLK
jgi:hypothetical protein